MNDWLSIDLVVGMSVYAEFFLSLSKYIVGPILLTTLAWRFFKIRPSGRLIIALSGVVVLSALTSLSEGYESMWYGVVFILLGLVLVDAVLLILASAPEVIREIPGRFAMGEIGRIKAKITNTSKMPLQVTFHDGLPEEAICNDLPQTETVLAKCFWKVDYPLKFEHRGDKELDASHLSMSTILGLWSRQVRSGEAVVTKVYPNYEPVVQFALLTMESRAEQMGIVMKNRVGMSKEFHQLRDYHLGDMLSQIDWKATSKRRSLISRDYQEQRDQNVILAIDCGKRMRSQDGKSSQFDHCLNAMLLLAYVALKQGDNVGILSFGGTERWLPPVKGVQSMTTILNHLYDYETSPNPSDYSEAAEKLLTHQRRRALVILLSNVRGEDGGDLIEPLRRMKQKHVVMLANLREHDISEQYGKDVHNLEEALTLSATQIYLDERSRVMEELRQYGVNTVDATAQGLPVALANRYLAERDNV